MGIWRHEKGMPRFHRAGGSWEHVVGEELWPRLGNFKLHMKEGGEALSAEESWES